MQWRAGTVIEQVRQLAGRRGVQPSALDEAPDTPVRALAYTAMVGTPAPGERVLLNASALLKGLGTGGLAFVVARPDHLPADPPRRASATSSRRATRPLQQMLLGVDEQDSPHHDALADADDLGRDAGGRRRPALRPAGGAGRHPGGEPAGAGRLRDDRRRGAARGVLAHRGRAGGCRVAGGDAHRRAGLRGRPRGRHHPHRPARGAARRAAPTSPWWPRGRATWAPAPAGATPGWPAPTCCTRPTCWAAAGSRRCACRAADRRERHRGISHHSRTAYGRALLTPADVPVTTLADAALDALVREQLAELVSTAAARR